MSARICEVYVTELEKATPTYIGTVRGTMENEKMNVENKVVSLFSGSCTLSQPLRCSAVRIRCLSIKEKVHLSVRSVACVGTLLCIDLPETKKSAQEQYPERLIVPNPIKFIQSDWVICRPEDSLSASLQTTFAQQVLFEGKMNRIEDGATHHYPYRLLQGTERRDAEADDCTGGIGGCCVDDGGCGALSRGQGEIAGE